jgi:hypothetical protein
MSWLRTLWAWLTSLFRGKKEFIVASAVCTLHSSGDLTAPKPGDLLTYTVDLSGGPGQWSIAPGKVTVTPDGGTATVIAVTQAPDGPWSWDLAQVVCSPPTVTGRTLAKPFPATLTRVDADTWQCAATV